MHAVEGLATNEGDEALDMTLEWAVMLAGAASGVAADAASGVAAGAAAGSLEADALTTTPEQGSTVPLPVPVLLRDITSLRFSLSTGTAAAAAAAAVSGTVAPDPVEAQQQQQPQPQQPQQPQQPAQQQAQQQPHAAGLSFTFEAPRGVSVDDR